MRRRSRQPPTRRRTAVWRRVRRSAGNLRTGARSRARGNKARAMEQRLAEFRAARKRAGLAAEPSTSSQSAQTSGENAEAAATPKPAAGWLKRFLVWKPWPASAQAQPNVAQVRGGRCRPGTWFLGRCRGHLGSSGQGPAPATWYPAGPA